MSEWIHAVAERANAGRDIVDAILAKHHIRPTPTLPRPRDLTLSRIRFAGRKNPEENPQEFEFKLDLGPGVWCLASYGDNFVGKSSVLEIILWALSGRHTHVQPDIRKWLEEVELSARIDGEPFTIQYIVQNGKPHGKLTFGSLSDTDSPVHGSFDSSEAFEEVMSAFMLERLGLEPMPFWQRRPQSEKGVVSYIGWPAYTSALYIPHASYKAVLGEEMHASQPGRLLQLFVGLPWAHTSAAARTALLRQEQEARNVARRQSEDSDARAQYTATLETRFHAAQEVIRQLSEKEASLEDLDHALDSTRAAANTVEAIRQRLSQAKLDLRAIQQERAYDRRQLQDLTETALARQFFHTLNPTICPRCDGAITSERREQEAAHAHCALCNRGLDAEDAHTHEEVILQVRAAAESSEQAYNESRTLVSHLTTELEEAETRYRDAREQVQRLGSRRQVLTEKRKAEIEVARIGGMLEEHRARFAGLTAENENAQELVILRAAHIEADHRAKLASSETLAELNNEVLRLAHDFGMDQLESVELDRAAHLKLRKGGEQTNFSSVTQGEKLRLKIAVVVAMLRIGHRRGVGRHPGLLIVDSPGAEEAGAEDLTQVLHELQRIADELPDLQILTATARADLVADIFPPQRIKIAPRGGTLW